MIKVCGGVIVLATPREPLVAYFRAPYSLYYTVVFSKQVLHGCSESALQDSSEAARKRVI